MILLWAFLFPLPGLALTALGLPRRPGVLSVPGPLLLLAVALWALVSGQPTQDFAVAGWAPFLPDQAFRLHTDGLATVMLVVVGAVSTCVYLYSLEYLHDDPRQRRFFCFLDLFVATMCLLVVAGNLTVLLIGWAGVGLSSFLLISFWWQKGDNLKAGLQALGANAIGDAALLVAVVLMPQGCGALSTLAEPRCTGVAGGATLIGALLVVAAAAKSAQGPLYFWLPSAMAGPTPVSALIHAATMVAAGVYLLVRASPLLALDQDVMHAVALLGVATALGGGVASLWQPNFKRGLAYSTVSQLGYMFAAVGVGAPFAAFFHLTTHASFKALLFLTAGVVIHACHGEERLAHLGGLHKKLPQAHALFLVGSLALIGFPLFAGGLSKDLILEAALHHSPVVGGLLLGGTLLTGLYTGRLFFGVFYGPEGAATHHVHAPGKLLVWPLVPLAVGAVAAGYVEAGTGYLSSALAPAVARPHEAAAIVSELGLGAAGLGVAGFALAGFLVLRGARKGLPPPPSSLSQAVWGEMRLLPMGVATAQSGRLGLYVLVTLLGTAAILFLGVRA